jgi:hypothetical protein
MTMLEDLREVVQACADANGHAPLSDTELSLRLFIKRHAEQIERDARDAARYRWLRLRDEHVGLAQDVDQAIDAAMAKEGE